MKKQLQILIMFVLLCPFTYGSFADGSVAKEEKKKDTFKKANIKKDAPRIEPNIQEEYKPLIEIYDRYWDFIKKDDLENAYKFETEDYRKTVSIREYKGLQRRSKFPVNIKAVRALEVKKENEKEVVVKGTLWMKAAMLDTLKVFYDKWTKVGDEWKHVREIEDFEDSEKEVNNDSEKKQNEELKIN